MKILLVLYILPSLIASNSLPVLYSPTCLSVPTISYNSLAVLPGSQIQHYSSLKSANIVLYNYAPLLRPSFTHSPSLRNASFTDFLPARVPQICMKDQISSYPELEQISSALVLAVEQGDVNYIKEGALVVRYTQNEILGRYLELENKHSDEICGRIERYYMNIWIGFCVMVSVFVWIIMDRGRDLFRDRNTEKSFMIELVENVEKVDRNIEEIQNNIERCNEDIDRILLKVDTSGSFQQTILSSSFKRSYSLPPLHEAKSPNSPSNQESLEDSIELEPSPYTIKEETPKEIQDSILSEKEETSELDKSFSSYEDLAEYSEEVEDSSLDFNSRVSREYDLARSLWGRSKKPGFMVSDV